VTFVSYAQNFEDVMLWRALRQVAHGFYIDVGAGHPDESSVTRAFYDRGWRGLNIEPSEHYFQRLAAARPLDTNLQLALGRRRARRSSTRCLARDCPRRMPQSRSSIAAPDGRCGSGTCRSDHLRTCAVSMRRAISIS